MRGLLIPPSSVILLCSCWSLSHPQAPLRGGRLSYFLSPLALHAKLLVPTGTYRFRLPHHCKLHLITLSSLLRLRVSALRLDWSFLAFFTSMAVSSTPVKADVWYEERKGSKLADTSGETGHVPAEHFIHAEHVPHWKQAHTVQRTVLQDGTGVFAGTLPLRRPQPLESRLPSTCLPRGLTLNAKCAELL